MKKLTMQIQNDKNFSYPIFISKDILLRYELWLTPYLKNKQIAIITDLHVEALYGNTLLKSLEKFNPILLSFEAGEESKHIQTIQFVYENMLKNHFNRDAIILALGGGVVGDLAGFIASTYMRGINYIQIPTTLLAMVDSSIGGKTGLNTPYGKNLIGSFYQPTTVVIDINALTTLPKIHFINGLIEALKMFITSSLEQFIHFQQSLEGLLNQNTKNIIWLIENAIKIKMDIVSRDEKENHQRAILNFGHTIGHALEYVTGYHLLHGHAVAYGMLVESKISELLGILSTEEFLIIQRLLSKLNFKGAYLKEINDKQLIQATRIDKKNKEDEIKYILIKKVGLVFSEEKTFTYPVCDEIVKEAILKVSEA